MEFGFIHIKLKIASLCPMELVLKDFDEGRREGRGKDSENKGAVAGRASARARKRSSHSSPVTRMHGSERPCVPTPYISALRVDSRSILVNLNCLVTVHQVSCKNFCFN